MRNLKRALSLALAFVMVMSMMVIGAGAVSIDDFTDKDEIVNTEAVTTMVSLGVIDGKDDGSYDPTGIVTRAEMAKLISVTLNGGKDPTLGAITANFTDTAGHWAESYIAYVSELHIIDGRGDGTFGPNDQVTGAQAAKMILTMLGYRSDIEGFTGANWAINVQTKGNDIDLFADMSINPDEGLTRDDTAQMLYNGVQSWMVEYRNLEGSYDGIVYPQPLNGTKDNSTVLIEKFKVRKVTGILEANDKVSVAGYINGVDQNGNPIILGHDLYSTALEGESLLYVTDVTGYSSADHPALYGPATYKVDTSDNMVGQEIVIYVKYLNDLSPNAASSVVVGTPILTDNNTVVETSARLKDASAVRSALREGGMTNIGTPVAILYTEGVPVLGVNTGITDSIVSPALRAADVNGDGTSDTSRSAGIFQRFIDNDGNGYPDYIIQIAPVLTSVNSVNTDATKYTFTGIDGTIDSVDVVSEEALERNDVVLINQFADGKYYVTYPDTVEGTVESYNTNNDTVSVDGTSYANSGGKNLGVSGTDQILIKEMVDNTYRFYLDDAGNVLGYIETETIVGNYAVVQGYSVDGNASMGYSARVKLLMQDGSTGTYDVNLTASAVRLGLADASDGNSAKEDAITIATYFDPNEANGSMLVNHLFSYTLDEGVVTLMRPQEVNADLYRSSYMNAGAENFDSYLTSGSIDKNTAEYNTTAGTIVANDQTVFFIKDWDDSDPADVTSDYYVVVGLANLPSTPVMIGNAIDTSNPADDIADVTVADTIAYKAPGSDTWVAKAIFITTPNKFEASRDFVFVTDKYVTRNVSGTPVYDFTVVDRNGETSTMTTSEDINTHKNTVREYYKDGSYYALDNKNTVDNAYIKSISGNTIVLHDIDTDAYLNSYRVETDADIWDVQDDPVKDSLQENDKVAVKLDASDVTVEAAFIYGVMSGVFTKAPTAITLGGLNLTAAPQTLTNYVAGTPLALSIELEKGVTPTLSVYVNNSTTATSITLGDADEDNIWTGTYTPNVGDKLDFVLKLAQEGLDSLTIKYGTITVKAVEAGAPVIDAENSGAQPVDAAAGGPIATVTATVPEGGTGTLSYEWFSVAADGTRTSLVGSTDYTGANSNTLRVGANKLENGIEYNYVCEVTYSEADKSDVTTEYPVSVTPNFLAPTSVTVTLADGAATMDAAVGGDIATVTAEGADEYSVYTWYVKEGTGAYSEVGAGYTVDPGTHALSVDGNPLANGKTYTFKCEVVNKSADGSQISEPATSNEVVVATADSGAVITAGTGTVAENVLSEVDAETKTISLKNAVAGNADLTVATLLAALDNAEGVYATNSLGVQTKLTAGQIVATGGNGTSTYNYDDVVVKSAGGVDYTLAFAAPEALAFADADKTSSTTPTSGAANQDFEFTLATAPDALTVSGSSSVIKVYSDETCSSALTQGYAEWTNGKLTLKLDAGTLDGTDGKTEKVVYVRVENSDTNLEGEAVALTCQYKAAAVAGTLTGDTTDSGTKSSVTINNYNGGSVTGFSIKVYESEDATAVSETVTASFTNATTVDFEGLALTEGTATYYIAVVSDYGGVESTRVAVTITYNA